MSYHDLITPHGEIDTAAVRAIAQRRTRQALHTCWRAGVPATRRGLFVEEQRAVFEWAVAMRRAYGWGWRPVRRAAP